MEFEGLLNGNQILIYFIGIFYILINDTFDKKQKIIMLYIFTYTLKLFNIMDLKVLFVVSNIVAFLYIGYLTNDELKNNILCNIWDKIKDYLYKCIFEYSSLYFWLSMALISITFQNYIQILKYVNIDIHLLGINVNIISILILGYTLNNVASCKYETNTFQEIKKKMNEIAIWTDIKTKSIDIEKLNMLIDVEDKSYFTRENTYNFMSWEFFKYRLDKRKIKTNKKYNKVKDLMLKKIYIKAIFKKLKKYIRGYSTIEMQIIRTVGVKSGYSEHIICRKIYEILYSKMFFKNLRKYMNKIYLNTNECCLYKEYLLIVYINIAKIKLNKKTYNNMLIAWNKKDLLEVSKEEFFISILGLSYRRISNDIINNYSSIIEKYNLNKHKLEDIIKKIEEE